MKYLLLISTILFAPALANAQAVGGAVFGPGTVIGTPRAGGGTADETLLQIKNCKKRIKATKKLVTEKKYYSAIQELLLANSIAITKDLQQDVISLVKEINRSGSARIAKADKLLKDGKIIEAAEEYRKISKIFSPLSTSHKARKKHKDLTSDFIYKNKVATIKAEKIDKRINRIIAAELKKIAKRKAIKKAKSKKSSKKASLKNSPSSKTKTGSKSKTASKKSSNNSKTSKKTSAKKDSKSKPKISVSLNNSPETERVKSIKVLSSKVQSKIYKLLKLVVKKYTDTKIAEIMKEEISQLEKDKKFVARIKRYAQKQACKNLFKKAQNFENAGLPKKAILYYKTIIRKYPKSKSAKRARKRLKSLGVILPAKN